ncbi:MAG: UDP-3-O-acyl-N-acetylglucosamine deacetylase [Planctomycetaceae bacterium]
MPQRLQHTIAKSVELAGVGFFSGSDVLLRFEPAEENFGIRFQRDDCPGSRPIPATLDFAQTLHRRTAIVAGDTQVAMVEHVMAALAGLRIDNCLVRLNGPEPPGVDGSCQPFVEALLQAGIVQQSSPRSTLVVTRDVRATASGQSGSVTAIPVDSDILVIAYELDYGPGSPIPSQQYRVEMTPESFRNEIAFARTFILESEVEQLRAHGYGKRVSAQDLLVYGDQGVVDNVERAVDECARHKILDCLGDLALIGRDLSGCIEAQRSGHMLNLELARALAQSYNTSTARTHREVA